MIPLHETKKMGKEKKKLRLHAMVPIHDADGSSSSSSSSPSSGSGSGTIQTPPTIEKVSPEVSHNPYEVSSQWMRSDGSICCLLSEKPGICVGPLFPIH
jgi:hypothetical protein